MPKLPPKIYEDHKCPLCGGDLVIKEKKFGKTEFIGCINYKHDGTGCGYTESMPNQNKQQSELLDRKCPECSKQLIKRFNKKNQPFIACTGFPECRYIESLTTKTTKSKGSKSSKSDSKIKN